MSGIAGSWDVGGLEEGWLVGVLRIEGREEVEEGTEG
jgi:hypothetical protein